MVILVSTLNSSLSRNPGRKGEWVYERTSGKLKKREGAILKFLVFWDFSQIPSHGFHSGNI